VCVQQLRVRVPPVYSLHPGTVCCAYCCDEVTNVVTNLNDVTFALDVESADSALAVGSATGAVHRAEHHRDHLQRNRVDDYRVVRVLLGGVHLSEALAILLEALRLVMVTIILKVLKLDSISFLYYNAPFCAVFIDISCYWFKQPRIPVDKFSLLFYALVVLNGFKAFWLSIASLVLINNTSALILSLPGVCSRTYSWCCRPCWCSHCWP